MRCAACNAELPDQSPGKWKGSDGTVEVDLCNSCKTHVDDLVRGWPSEELAAVIQARALHFHRHGNTDGFDPTTINPDYGRHVVIHMVGVPYVT